MRKTSSIVESFINICMSFGIIAGGLGLGIGLLFLTVPQAIGLGLLATSLGTLLTAFVGAKKILHVLIETLDELENDDLDNNRKST